MYLRAVDSTALKGLRRAELGPPPQKKLSQRLLCGFVPFPLLSGCKSLRQKSQQLVRKEGPCRTGFPLPSGPGDPWLGQRVILPIRFCRVSCGWEFYQVGSGFAVGIGDRSFWQAMMQTGAESE